MKKLYPIAVLLIMLSSCSVRLNYYGRSATPTGRADVYLYERDISVPYEVLGRADVTKTSFVLNTSDKVKNLLLAEAKKVGADAVILYDENQMPLPPTISTTTSKDQTVNAPGTQTSVTTAQEPEPVFSPVFIKYKSASEN